MAQREAEIRAEAQGALLTALRTEARTAEDPDLKRLWSISHARRASP
jgi:hypothetical protein